MRSGLRVFNLRFVQAQLAERSECVANKLGVSPVDVARGAEVVFEHGCVWYNRHRHSKGRLFMCCSYQIVYAITVGGAGCLSLLVRMHACCAVFARYTLEGQSDQLVD